MNQVPTNAVPRTIPESQVLVSDQRIVPFDQLVTFELTGKPNNVLTNVISISSEGHFVAVAIGYSILPEVEIEFGPVLRLVGSAAKIWALQNVTIGNLVEGFRRALEKKAKELEEKAKEKGQQWQGWTESDINEQEQQLLRRGFQLNPLLAEFVVSQGGLKLDVLGLDDDTRSRLFQVVSCQQREVNFLYSIIDNGSGRAFQSEPIHNIGGLGLANGDRPFRFFPYPIVFRPRSVIQVQITEKTGNGRLYFVLQGYKVLGTRSQLTE